MARVSPPIYFLATIALTILMHFLVPLAVPRADDQSRRFPPAGPPIGGEATDS